MADSVDKSVAGAMADSVAADSGMAEVMSSLPSDAVVEIWRRDENTKTYAFTAVRYAPDEFTVEAVERDLGGGNFQLRIRYLDPSTGHRGYLKGSRVFSIEGPPKTPRAKPVDVEDEGVAPVVMPTGDGRADTSGMVSLAVMTLLRQMQDNSAAQLEASRQHGAMMLEMVRSMRGGGPDPLVLELIRTGLGRKDPIEDVTKIAQLIGGRGEKSSLAELLEAIRTLRESSDLLTGAAEASPLGVAEKGLDTLNRLIDSRRSEAPSPTPRVDAAVPPKQLPRPGDGAAPSTPAAPALPEDPNMRMWKRRVRVQLANVQVAVRMMSPHTAASFILDNATETEEQDIVADVLDGNFVDRAVKDLPVAPEFADYVQETLEELEDMVHDRIEAARELAEAAGAGESDVGVRRDGEATGEARVESPPADRAPAAEELTGDGE